MDDYSVLADDDTALQNFNRQDLRSFFLKSGDEVLAAAAETLYASDIDGHVLLTMSHDDLVELGISFGQRKKLERIIKARTFTPGKSIGKQVESERKETHSQIQEPDKLKENQITMEFEKRPIGVKFKENPTKRHLEVEAIYDVSKFSDGLRVGMILRTLGGVPLRDVSLVDFTQMLLDVVLPLTITFEKLASHSLKNQPTAPIVKPVPVVEAPVHSIPPSTRRPDGGGGVIITHPKPPQGMFYRPPVQPSQMYMGGFETTQTQPTPPQGARRGSCTNQHAEIYQPELKHENVIRRKRPKPTNPRTRQAGAKKIRSPKRYREVPPPPKYPIPAHIAATQPILCI